MFHAHIIGGWEWPNLSAGEGLLVLFTTVPPLQSLNVFSSWQHIFLYLTNTKYPLVQSLTQFKVKLNKKLSI